MIHDMSEDHSRAISYLRTHYSALARSHGDSPQAVQYSDHGSHWARLRILCDIGVSETASIADIGCGTAELLRYLKTERRYTGDYLGVDICDDQLAIARAKFPEAKFEMRNVLTHGLDSRVDFVVINGVFNNKLPGVDGFSFAKDVLRALMPHVRKGIAFNAMSTYVDYRDDGLCYIDPSLAFAFCKENLSNLVTLRHDYSVRPEGVPFEYAVYVYRDAAPCRRNTYP
jgi:SAM-dependent methyltransferase